jgi:hypothetical protein
MVQELIYPSNELPAHLKYQILSLLRIVWPEGFVGENKLRDWISRIVRTWARLPASPEGRVT